MSDSLPNEIVAGMKPILSKYGIVVEDRQGRVMVGIGEILRDMNSKEVRSQKEARKIANKAIRKISVLLYTYGVNDEKSRQKCTYEIWDFIDNLAQGMMKDGSAQ